MGPELHPGIRESEIERMMQSFDFERCIQSQVAELFRTHLSMTSDVNIEGLNGRSHGKIVGDPCT